MTKTPASLVALAALSLLHLGLGAPAKAQGTFASEVTGIQLHGIGFQRRILEGSTVDPYRWRLTEFGFGPYDGISDPPPPPLFADVLAFTFDENDLFGPVNPAAISYNGFTTSELESPGLLNGIPLDQFFPGFVVIDPDPDAQPLFNNPQATDSTGSGVEYGNENVLIVTPDFSNYTAGQTIRTGVILLDEFNSPFNSGLSPDEPNPFVDLNIDPLSVNPGPRQLVPRSPGFSGPGSPLNEPNAVRVAVATTEIVAANQLVTDSGPGDPADDDAGRHMLDVALGQLIVADTAPTDGGTIITVQGRNNGGLATLDEGLVLQSSSDFNVQLRGGGTASFDVFRTEAGAYDLTGGNAVVLPADNAAPDGDGGTELRFGDEGAPLITAEQLGGNNLDLSGVTVTVKGAALEDRQLSLAPLNLGRVVVDAEQNLGVQTADLKVTTVGADDATTRLQLGAGVAGGELEDDTGRQLLRAEVFSDTAFTGASDLDTGANTADAQLTYEFKRGDDDLGVFQSESVAFDGTITTLENGGAGLDGQDVQTQLNAGLSYTPVKNNRVVAEDVLFVGLEGGPAISGTFQNATAAPEFSNTTHTDITVDQDFTVSNLSLAPSEGLQIVQAEILSVDNGRVELEGLAGETTNTEAYNVNAIFLLESEAQNISQQEVGNGDTIRVRNKEFEPDPQDPPVDPASFGVQAGLKEVGISVSGAENRFSVERAAGSPEVANPGQELSFDVAFDFTDAAPAAGQLDRIYAGTVRIGFNHELPTDLVADLGFTDGPIFANHLRMTDDPRTLAWDLRQLVKALPPAPGDPPLDPNSGSADLAAGTDLGNGGLFLDPTPDDPNDDNTTVGIIDSDPLTENTTVELEIDDDWDEDPVYNFAVGFEDGFGNLASVRGLDGVLHVIQLSYSDGQRRSVSPDSPETLTEVRWFDDSVEGARWVNAVLGNSDIDRFDDETVVVDGIEIALEAFLAERRYTISYLAYLDENGGNPTLGDFGVDTLTNTVWAVIDHNSDFVVAIPEPATLALALVATPALFRRRRAA